MDTLVKHYDALVNLLFGAAFAITAGLILVRQRNIFGMALALSMGAVFTALGWLALQGLIGEIWVRTSTLVGAGVIVLVIQRISRISSRPKIDPTRSCQ